MLRSLLALAAAFALSVGCAEARPMGRHVGSSSGSYSAGVVAASLQAVADLASTGTGPRVSLTHTPLTDGSTLTSCGNTGSGTNIVLTGSCTLTAWDFSGNFFQVDGVGNTVTCNDCKFQQTGNTLYNLVVGNNSNNGTKTPTFNCNYCEFDWTTTTALTGGMVTWLGSTTNLSHVYGHDASTNYIDNFGIVTVSYSYFRGPGHNAGSGLLTGGHHFEDFHQYNRMDIDHTLIDVSDTSGNNQAYYGTASDSSPGGCTSVGYAATNATFIGSLTYSIVRGTPCAGGSIFTWQVGHDTSATTTITFTGNAIASSPNGYVAANPGGVVTDGGGNKDYTSGSSLSLP